MPRYLLDTSIISNLVAEPSGPVAEIIARIGTPQVCTSIIVAAELRYGVVKRDLSRLTGRVEAVLAALDVLPFQARWRTPLMASYGVT